MKKGQTTKKLQRVMNNLDNQKDKKQDNRNGREPNCKPQTPASLSDEELNNRRLGAMCGFNPYSPSFNKEIVIEDKDIIEKCELLDFVLLLENAFNKKGEVSKGEVADILSDFKKKFKQQGRDEVYAQQGFSNNKPVVFPVEKSIEIVSAMQDKYEKVQFKYKYKVMEILSELKQQMLEAKNEQATA
jgi:hypothetical protein